MTPERWQRVSELFTAALECDETAREALLQQACGGDPELRAEVNRLLSDDLQASCQNFMKATPAAADGSDQNPVRRILENLELRIEEPAPVKTGSSEKPAAPGRALFSEANWALIKSARNGDLSQARWALAELGKVYWYPIYAYIRRRGYSTHQAQELTHGFFLFLLESDFLNHMGQDPGTFRAFLLTYCRDYLINESTRERARKQGEGRVVLNVELTEAEAYYAREQADTMTPEGLFNRCWTFTLLHRVLQRLKADLASSGKQLLVDRLVGAVGSTSETASCTELARELKMPEEAVRVAVHRLRRRHRELVRDEVRRTVATSLDIDGEIRALMNCIVT